MKNNKCIFCNCNLKKIYNLNNYQIVQCENCKTCTVETIPTTEELQKYYNGFSCGINEDNKKIFLDTKFSSWYKSYNLPNNAKMLDIGGGGGYFSMSFEYFNIGKATYIDLDPKSCEYAKSLNISNVINDDVCNLAIHNKEKYDFIYSRHLIEHLTNPLVLIDAGIKMLSDDGVFVLQFPNGLSFERLCDKEHYRNRRCLLKISNPGFNKCKIFSILHSKQTAFGLDPIRHLWAISSKGISEYLRIKNVDFKIKTYGIEDSVYSPYFIKESKLKSITRNFLSLFNGKSHLVVEIRKKKQ